MLFKAFDQAYNILGTTNTSSFLPSIYEKDIIFMNHKKLSFLSQNLLSSPDIVGKYSSIDDSYSTAYEISFDSYMYYVDIYGRPEISCSLSETVKFKYLYSVVLINYLSDNINENERLILDTEVMALRDIYESVFK